MRWGEMWEGRIMIYLMLEKSANIEYFITQLKNDGTGKNEKKQNIWLGRKIQKDKYLISISVFVF